MKHPKHHFVPEFYLKRWSKNNKDKRLYSCRYFKGNNKIHWTPHAPSGTAYERDLYGEIEEIFFKPLDNDASNILERFEKKNIKNSIKLDMGEEDHYRWAIFILGFIFRTPDRINYLHEISKNYGVDINTAKKQIPKIIKSDRAIKDLRALRWVFARVDINLELLTCDNPLIFKPNNLSHPNCVIILPMSPKHFFLATHKENISRIEKDPRKMVANINIEIIKNANKRIYAQNKYSVKDSFIMKHWSTKTST